ncbi:MAG: T9SS type A sorting domain-containing protein [Candidatus Eisenbacteria bacterium]|nr:T9SS type A sorting domain-containing protein [Candidatus Eisenbacteria bacterium]
MPRFHRSPFTAAILAVLGGAFALLPAGAPVCSAQTSLRFHGNGSGDIDRVKIALDGPERPVDVGATDFTLEFWLRALAGENGAGACAPGNDNWIVGHVVIDRDIYGPGDLGDFGISLFESGLAFGAANQTSGTGICGSIAVDDGEWHHVAVTRRRSDGQLRLFVDGGLDAEADGPNGDLSYRNGRATSFPNSDPFLVLGAEKHDAGLEYPSFAGWLDELRVSTVLRYTGPFVRPTAPFVTDGSTAALYHFDEGTGTVLGDGSGAPGGPSDGVIRYGGAPAGPEWSSDSPFGPPVGIEPSFADAPSRLEVSSNPFTRQVSLRLVHPTTEARHTAPVLSILDAGGREVAAVPPRWDGEQIRYDWSGPPGIYFARVSTRSGTLTRKLIALP